MKSSTVTSGVLAAASIHVGTATAHTDSVPYITPYTLAGGDSSCTDGVEAIWSGWDASRPIWWKNQQDNSPLYPASFMSWTLCRDAGDDGQFEYARQMPNSEIDIVKCKMSLGNGTEGGVPSVVISGDEPFVHSSAGARSRQKSVECSSRLSRKLVKAAAAFAPAHDEL